MARIEIQLLPSGKILHTQANAALQQILFPEGVEFPCGGRGRCKGCRIRVLQGHLDVNPEDRRLFSEEELAQGWRLACRAHAGSSLVLELAQWEPSILSDNTPFCFTPRSGFGIAVDLGTTTLVAQLLNLKTGAVLGVTTALNPQAQHGADIMSRIEFAMRGGQPELQSSVRNKLGAMIAQLVQECSLSAGDIQDVTVVGNTAMHHLFCGVDVKPLSHYPFAAERDGLHTFRGLELGWPVAGNIHFLPCLGGFVGSDILAGILATGQHRSDELVALVDLGTNGEIVVGNRQRMLCASTAAGPAFEGARISAGMRAATGAIVEVWDSDGSWGYRVLGEGPPRGICGSGLVDAVAVALENGQVQPSGRLSNSEPLTLAPGVALQQQDIRELQLAKAAIAAGFRLLTDQWGTTPGEVSRVHLAGAFGNYVRWSSAARIGLLPVPESSVEPVGNTALRGAKMALFDLGQTNVPWANVRTLVQHVSLSDSERFQELFVDEMRFPARTA